MQTRSQWLSTGGFRVRARFALLLTVVALAIPVSAGQPSKGEDAVRIERMSGSGYVSLMVENHQAYDVTVELTITSHNARIERIRPETAVYAGHSRTEAVRIFVADPGQRWRWRYRFQWTKGSIDAKHDDRTLYRLPFEAGRTFRVSQSYNGRLSHRGPNQYAVDFAMPEGTIICAARDGVVVDLKESSNTGGPDEKYTSESNYVSITHADGTIGEYHHLQKDGVLVEIGDRIVAGQPIARSGNTGFSTMPHLHFGVYSAADAEQMQSHRITFATAQGLIKEPRPGRRYTAE